MRSHEPLPSLRVRSRFPATVELGNIVITDKDEFVFADGRCG
jgi:hypothetical protein